MNQNQKVLIPGVFNGSNNIFCIKDNQHRQNPKQGIFEKCFKDIVVIAESQTWLNDECQKIGYGDLSVGDIKRISKKIPQNELFIVVDIKHFGEFQRTPLEKSCTCDVSFVFEHMRMLIVRNHILKFFRNTNFDDVGEYVGKEKIHNVIQLGKFDSQKILECIS